MGNVNFQFEVCANSVDSCLAAQCAGADRVELCAGMPEGGTTPSFATIETARELLDKCLLHVIVRPRGGDFLYSRVERRIILRDIRNVCSLHVDGVVCGCLREDGQIDKDFLKELLLETGEKNFTFHRAFDVCSNPFRAVEDLVEVADSVDFKGELRLLTSGQRANAYEGVPLLKELKERVAGTSLHLMAGCGVNEKNIAKIARATGIAEFHFSARENMATGMRYTNPQVSMGGTVMVSEREIPVTTERRVRATIQALTDAPVL